MSSVTYTIAEKEIIIGKQYTLIKELMTQIQGEKNEKRLEELRCLEADAREKAYQMSIGIYREQQDWTADEYTLMPDDAEEAAGWGGETDFFAELVAQANKE